jgi:hypothetical protein
MRWISLFVICSGGIFYLVITPLLLQVQDLLDQYNGYRYLASSLLGHGSHNHQDAAAPPMGDKIIVIASLELEDTSWVAEKLPEYAALNEASPTQGPPLANLAVTSQLAARDISRQPFQSFRSFITQLPRSRHLLLLGPCSSPALGCF